MVRPTSLVVILLSGLLLSPACSGTQGESEPPNPDSNTYRLSVGVGLIRNVYVTRLDRLVAATAQLKTAADNGLALAQAEGTFEPDTLQTQWLAVMALVQELEVMHVGPGANALTRKGGESLRDTLYSWPLTNACRVDQVLVSKKYAEDGFRDRVMANVYGLDTLEQLLFRPHDEHTCPPQLPIETEGQWDDLGVEGRALARAEYSAVVAKALDDDAKALRARWASDSGDFMSQVENPGGDSAFSTPQCVLDELFAAMFHFDLVTKDERLAVPTGISPDCSQPTCANKLEFQLALQSGLSVQSNITGLAALFSGESGDGFDALLRAEGASELADELQSAIAEAQSAARALEVDWADLLRNDPQALRDLHGKVKTVTDLLKTQFATVLNLSVPQEGAGDND